MIPRRRAAAFRRHRPGGPRIEPDRSSRRQLDLAVRGDRDIGRDRRSDAEAAEDGRVRLRGRHRDPVARRDDAARPALPLQRPDTRSSESRHLQRRDDPARETTDGVKIVLIVLALVAAAFVAIIVYGVNRDEPAATASSRGGEGCNSGPPPMRDGEPDEDALEDGASRSSAPPPTGCAASSGPASRSSGRTWRSNGFPCGDPSGAPLEEKLRVAKLLLTSGDSARVTAVRDDDDDSTVCLCRPGAKVDAADLQGCGRRWIAKQTAATCEADAGEGSLPFGKKGGALSFAAAHRAGVASNRIRHVAGARAGCWRSAP